MRRGAGIPDRAGSFACAVPVAVFALVAAVAAFGWRWKNRFTTYEIAGNSMLPTLSPGDFVIVDRAAYRARAPRPSEIVLAQDPRDARRTIVKRVDRRDPEGCLWLSGDNPAESTDSRAFGAIPAALIVGRVAWRYWRSAGGRQPAPRPATRRCSLTLDKRSRNE